MSYSSNIVLVFLFWLAVAAVKGGPRDEESVTGVACACPVVCTQVADNGSGVLIKDGYIYDSTVGDCVPLDVGCSTECVFSSLEMCQSNCVKDNDGGSLSDCQGTEYGCCPDKLTARNKDGNCPDEMEIDSVVHEDSSDKKVISPNHTEKERGGVRWDLVGVGVGVMVMLIVVLVLSGIVTYTYRNSHKDKQRSRYIHQVLQMYEDGSDSSCDFDDDPETNNLFERL